MCGVYTYTPHTHVHIIPASNEQTSTPVEVPTLCNADSAPVCCSTDRAFDAVRGWNVASSCRINVTDTLLKSKIFFYKLYHNM